GRDLRRLRLRGQSAQYRRAYREFDAREAALLSLPAGQDPLGIMRLNPALEEAGRHRQLHGITLAAVKLHAREPAGVDIVADFGPQTLPNTCPALLIHCRHLHRVSSDRQRRMGRTKTTAELPAPIGADAK